MFNAAPLDELWERLLVYHSEFNDPTLPVSIVRHPVPTDEFMFHKELGRVETQLKAIPGTEFSLGSEPRSAIAATPDGSVKVTNLVIDGIPNPEEGETVGVMSISFTYN